MSRIYKNNEGNYMIDDGGRYIMLLDNGSSFEKVKLNYRFETEDMVEVEDLHEKFDLLKKAGLRK